MTSLVTNQRNQLPVAPRSTWYKIVSQPVLWVSALVVISVILLAILAPYITPYDALHYFDYSKVNQGPSLQHWFGVDALGRDVFSRVLLGARISLFIGIFAAFAGGFIGVFLGLIAGYYQGFFERVIMRFCDLLFAFPGILLAIAIVAVMGTGVLNVAIAVMIFSIPTFARLVRGDVLQLKHQLYIEAARSIGAKDSTIIWCHILPGTAATILVYLTSRIGTAIIAAASLSFLGLGSQPPTPEWGAMLNEARADLALAPHAVIFPSLAIFITVLAFNFLGDALHDNLVGKAKRT